MSAALENSTLSAVKVRALNNSRVIALDDWGLIRRLAAEGGRGSDRASAGNLAEHGDQGGEVGFAASYAGEPGLTSFTVFENLTFQLTTSGADHHRPVGR